MKHINIISLTQAFDTLEKEEYKNLLSYHSIEIKDAEINDLKSMIIILNTRATCKFKPQKSQNLNPKCNFWEKENQRL